MPVMVSERFYWRAKLVKGGVYVGVMTWFGPPIVDGETFDRHYRWLALIRNEKDPRAILMGDNCPIEVEGIQLRSVEPTTKADYEFMVAHSAYATVHRPDLPDASPSQAIDHFKSKVPF